MTGWYNSGGSSGSGNKWVACFWSFSLYDDVVSPVVVSEGNVNPHSKSLVEKSTSEIYKYIRLIRRIEEEEEERSRRTNARLRESSKLKNKLLSGRPFLRRLSARFSREPSGGCTAQE